MAERHHVRHYKQCLLKYDIQLVLHLCEIAHMQLGTSPVVGLIDESGVEDWWWR